MFLTLGEVGTLIIGVPSQGETACQVAWGCRRYSLSLASSPLVGQAEVEEAEGEGLQAPGPHDNFACPLCMQINCTLWI